MSKRANGYPGTDLLCVSSPCLVRVCIFCDHRAAEELTSITIRLGARSCGTSSESSVPKEIRTLLLDEQAMFGCYEGRSKGLGKQRRVEKQHLRN